MKTSLWTTLSGLFILSDAQYLSNGTFASAGLYGVRYDTGSFGPEVEEIHYFTNQWRKIHPSFVPRILKMNQSIDTGC